MGREYNEFLADKFRLIPSAGIEAASAMPDSLFKPHQQALVKWALKKGRSAIFADTGLGKTRMEIAWAETAARETGKPILILAPLAVAAQSVREAERLSIAMNHCRSDSDVRDGLNIINYDRLHLIDPERFGGVVLDESSCIKHQTTKTFTTLLEMFEDTPFKLCASATPAPNDWTELGTHAQFLGICSVSEMLSEFFVHDGAETQVWRLKGHARKAFWKWVSGWGAMVRRPSDLGFDDTGYVLPPLTVKECIVGSTLQAADGRLFAMEASTLSERRDARRASLTERVHACATAINAHDGQELVWCDLNAESEALAAAIDDAVEIRGSDDSDKKERALLDFAEGRVKRLITKPSIAGWGMNFQRCYRQSFVGVTDSYEAYYQAVRRCYRFGQTMPVEVNIYISEFEGPVLANLRRKEADAEAMASALSAETKQAVLESVFGTARQTNTYNASRNVKAPSWLSENA